MVGVVAGTPEGFEQHVDWRKARTEAVAVAVVVCCVVVGFESILFSRYFLFSIVVHQTMFAARVCRVRVICSVMFLIDSETCLHYAFGRVVSRAVSKFVVRVEI